jgi:signal transduction histidine kinase
VILITGEPNLETATEAVRQGAFDYISKPVTKEALLEVVGRGLRHVSLLRERDQARQVELDVLRNLARLGESASVLTHEIRTPMTSLRQALRAVGDKLGIGDRALVEELVQNLDRIEVMLGRALSFVRPLRLQLARVSLESILESARAQAGALPVVQGMHVEVDCARGLPAIEGDQQLLGEVFVNLLRNAAEACDGVGRVAITASLHGPKIVVDVRDDGPGVPAGRRDEIFRPFHSSKDYGTGIGLAFCRKVIESHGGTIGLTDDPAPGACFRVELKPGGA